MGKIVELQKNPSVDYPDEIFTQVPVVVQNNDTDQTLCSITTKPGKRPFLVVLGCTIDASAQAYVTYTLKQDGVPFFPFAQNQNQFSDPTFPSELPRRFPLKQLTTYALTARVSASGPATANAIGRMVIEYEDF